MWETITKILTSNNSLQILTFILIIFIILILLVKGNYLKVNTKFLKLGEDEKERSIIRQQIEWSKHYITGNLFGFLMNKYKNIDPLKTKLILCLIYEEVIDWISFNHITKHNTYLSVKQDKLKSIIYSDEKIDNCLKTKEFRDIIDTWTQDIIFKLYEIREYNK